MTSNTEVDTASEISDMDAVEDVAPPAPAAQECTLSMPPLSLSPSPPQSLRQSPSVPTACPPSSSSSDLATGWDVSSESSGFHQDIPSSSSMVGNLHNLNIKSPLSLPDSPLSESSLTHDLSSAAEGAAGEICPSGDSFDTLRRELDGDSNSRNSSQHSEGAADQSEMDSLARVGVVASATLATSVTDQNSSEEELECIIRENNHHENRKRSQVVSGGPGAGGGAQEEEEEEEGEGGGGGGSGGRERCVEEEEEEEEEEEGEESMVPGSGTHHVHHPHNQSQHLHNSQHHHHHHHHHHPLHHHHHSPHQRQPHHSHHSQSHCIKNTNHNNNKSSWSCRRCLEDPASSSISATTTSPPPPPSHSGSILMSNTALCNNNNNNIMHNNNNINNNNNNNNSSNNIIAGGAPDIPVNCHTIANNENANSTCCVLGNMADSAGSSDEEVKEFMLDPKPVIFSSGPPAGLPKVMRTTATNFLLPNPPSFSICAISPRKRHRLNSNSDSLDLENMTVIQRPCLDFEKMQKTLMCKHNSHNVSRAKIVKIKTVSGNGTSSKCLFDPAVCSFRSISTAYSPLPPVEEPSCAY